MEQEEQKRAGPKVAWKGTVALQGSRGSFSHQALAALLPLAEPLFCKHPEETFAAITAREADAILLPLRNSLAGPVLQHYELLRTNLLGPAPLRCLAECNWPVHQQLIGLPGTVLSQIEEVFSHPMALAQCRRFFCEYPMARAVEFHDTAAAVEHIVRAGDPRLAAIASVQAAREFGGEMLLRDIHDHPGNATCFALLAQVPNISAINHDAAVQVGAVLLTGLAGGQLKQVLEATTLQMRSLVLLTHGEQLWQNDGFLEFNLPSGDVGAAWAAAKGRIAKIHPRVTDLGVFEDIPVLPILG